MLILGSRLIGTPVMGLQTGARLAQASQPLIDPANLKIVAYIVDGPLLDQHPSVLRMADVREFGDLGMIIDSSDELIGIEDVIKVKSLHDLNFSLNGMPVIDESKRRLGKVEDFGVDSDSFIIQQLHVRRGLLRSLTDTGLIIHRSQITEINDTAIIVKTTAKKVTPVMIAERPTYVNPFRNTSTQPDTSDTQSS